MCCGWTWCLFHSFWHWLLIVIAVVIIIFIAIILLIRWVLTRLVCILIVATIHFLSFIKFLDENSSFLPIFLFKQFVLDIIEFLAEQIHSNFIFHLIKLLKSAFVFLLTFSIFPYNLKRSYNTFGDFLIIDFLYLINSFVRMILFYHSIVLSF